MPYGRIFYKDECSGREGILVNRCKAISQDFSEGEEDRNE
jgi:hypothetical protein